MSKYTRLKTRLNTARGLRHFRVIRAYPTSLYFSICQGGSLTPRNLLLYPNDALDVIQPTTNLLASSIITSAWYQNTAWAPKSSKWQSDWKSLRMQRPPLLRPPPGGGALKQSCNLTLKFTWSGLVRRFCRSAQMWLICVLLYYLCDFPIWPSQALL